LINDDSIEFIHVYHDEINEYVISP